MAKHDPALNDIFLALSDPTRRAILERLSAGDRVAVGELAAPFGMALPSFMKHIDMLRRAGLIGSTKKGRVRFCWAEMDTLRPADHWIDGLHAEWAGRTDRLAAFARTLGETE